MMVPLGGGGEGVCVCVYMCVCALVFLQEACILFRMVLIESDIRLSWLPLLFIEKQPLVFSW